jgi:shikimate dehydrogenase
LTGSSVGAAAVLGKPIEHSLSPILHRAAYHALELSEWRYDAIECDEAQLAELLLTSGPDVVGYSCTMPLKREVLRVATSASMQARAIGAGNTLLRIDDDWHADNTDWVGIAHSLSAAGVSTKGKVVVLGAGGTAQAALAALEDAAELTVLVREPARATDLLATAERLDLDIRVARMDQHGSLADADLIVSTLPAGAADPLASLPWRPDQALLDAVYAPWPTPLAAAVSAGGGVVVSGAAMLLHQAGRQVELMTGMAAPVRAMRAALLRAVPDAGV